MFILVLILLIWRSGWFTDCLSSRQQQVKSACSEVSRGNSAVRIIRDNGNITSKYNTKHHI